MNKTADCYRCGEPSENPGESWMGGKDSMEPVVVCGMCFQLSMIDPDEFWRVIREKEDKE